MTSRIGNRRLPGLPPRHDWGAVGLYGLTIALGAFLLFWIQPLFAKQVLPLLGGAPGVWNAALVFFQGTLLLGYLYAHLLSRLMAPPRQVLLHLTLLAGAFLLLPFGIPEGWTPWVNGAPGLWILGLFAVAIGLPFFVVSATAPLLQRWFARTRHPGSDDPYFLYSASNLGSMGALLAFPLLLEPWIGLLRQAHLWKWAFVALGLLLAACGIVMIRGRTVNVDATEASPRHSEAVQASSLGPRAADRLWWCVLAFAPSSLLLGVTTHMTTDVAAVPLLWIAPLLLYLGSFAIVFARRPILKHTWMLRAQPHAVVLLTLAILFPLAFFADVAVHLIGFFLIAMACHGELVGRRPDAHHLTEFYLYIALGGVLGGAFNALAAPHLFDTVLEYPLMVAAACAVRPVLDGSRKLLNASDLLFPGLLLVGVLIAGALATGLHEEPPRPLALGVFAVAALTAFSFRRRPFRLALGVGALLVAFPLTFGATAGDVLARERSFFGVHSIRIDETGDHYLLYHGTTLHGAQAVGGRRRGEPLTYYSRESPIGEVLSSSFGESREDGATHAGSRESGGLRSASRIGVVGLGTGSLACHRREGQTWVFFEIDPVVVRIATESRHFDFLARCAPNSRIVLGDARLTLQSWAGPPFDILVIDAFSSDAIPVHLLTLEAVRLYFTRLSPEGLVAFHVSNRHLSLWPLLGVAADELGLAAVRQFQRVRDAEERRHISASDWVVMAREEDFLRDHLRSNGWERVPRKDGLRPWTDDFSNILSVLR